MIGRWALLAHAADSQVDHAWTPSQVALAFDLLATPEEFRLGNRPGASVDEEGRVLESGADSAAVARGMVAELKERREAIGDLDEVERALAEADLDHDGSAEVRRIRRYESALHTRFCFSIKEIGRSTFDLKPDPGLVPRWLPTRETPRPEPRHPDEVAAANHPANSWQPPFCLEPDEYPPIGEKADIPAILSVRKAKRIAKAEARRNIRRRRVDGLRA